MKNGNLSPERVKEIWFQVKDSPSLWGELEGHSLARFVHALETSDFVFDFGFGLGRITDLVRGHKARIHGIFWSKEYLKNTEKLSCFLSEIMQYLELGRLECIIPAKNKALNRLISRGLGMTFEGCLRSYYKRETNFEDANIYSLIRGGNNG